MTGTSRSSTPARRPWSGSGSRPTKAEPRVAVEPGPTGDSHPHSINPIAWKVNSTTFGCRGSPKLASCLDLRSFRLSLPYQRVGFHYRHLVDGKGVPYV